MQASDVYALVSQRLQDMEETRRWPWEAPDTDNDVSMQRFLNNAMLLVTTQRPDATATVKEHTCRAGALQELTSDDLYLLDCLAVLDSEGDHVRTITRIDRKNLDSFLTDWPGQDGDIWHWSYDRTLAPSTFWLAYGATSGQTIKVVMSEKPTTVSDPTDNLNISPLYQAALAEIILYQIFASDSESANWNKAMGCLENFAQIMGIKLRADLMAPYKPSQAGGE